MAESTLRNWPVKEVSLYIEEYSLIYIIDSIKYYSIGVIKFLFSLELLKIFKMESEVKAINYRSENMKKARLTKLEKQKKEKEEKEYQRLLELQAKRKGTVIEAEPEYIEEDDSNDSEEVYTYVPMKKTKKTTTKSKPKAKPKTTKETREEPTNSELEELRKYKEEVEKQKQMKLPHSRFPEPVASPTNNDQLINAMKHKILNF